MVTDVDSFIFPGFSHNICQDYILKQNDPFPAIVLCDGCSTSPYTEVGSQILCHTFMNWLNKCPKLIQLDDPLFMYNVFKDSSEIINRLGLTQESLNCTLLYIIYYDGHIYYDVYGDGLIFVVSNGESKLIEINFSSNMPFYYAYTLNKRNSDHYFKQNEGEKKRIREIHFKDARFKEKKSENGTDIPFCEENYENTVHIPKFFELIELDSEDNSKGIEFIGISSDGLSSFINRSTRELVGLNTIIPQVFSFKSLAGEFLNRRMKRMVSDLSKESIFPSDDLSCGLLNFKKSG